MHSIIIFVSMNLAWLRIKYVRNIRIGKKKKNAFRRMKIGKAIGSDCILIKLWKSLEDEGISWLT